jgi:hypothetical protein
VLFHFLSRRSHPLTSLAPSFSNIHFLNHLLSRPRTLLAIHLAHSQPSTFQKAHHLSPSRHSPHYSNFPTPHYPHSPSSASYPLKSKEAYITSAYLYIHHITSHPTTSVTAANNQSSESEEVEIDMIDYPFQPSSYLHSLNTYLIWLTSSEVEQTDRIDSISDISRTHNLLVVIAQATTT